LPTILKGWTQAATPAGNTNKPTIFGPFVELMPCVGTLPLDDYLAELKVEVTEKTRIVVDDSEPNLRCAAKGGSERG